MDILQAIQALKDGKSVVYPTDTIWGIGCDATNEEACLKIFTIKKRSLEKSCIVLVDSIQMLEKYVPDFHPICYDLIEMSEQPLTIVYPSCRNLAPSIVSVDGSIAIRVTKDPICLKLIRGMKKPIVSTSANVSGEVAPNCFDDISSAILSCVDGVLEERTHETMNQASKIIQIDLKGNFKILRP